jgi:GT2 family glycosyltransferase
MEVHAIQKNLGFGGGHNLLAKKGDAQYLFFLNPDTRIIESQSIQLLIRRASECKAQIVGPRLVMPSGKTQRWDHGELHGWKAWLTVNSGNSYWRERKEAVRAAWVSGAALLIEKKSFDNLNGFDENFFLYKEEEELCWRLRISGGNIVYDPTISIFHHVGVVAKKAEHLRKSTDYFLQKHFRHRFGYSFFRLINKVLH